MNTNSNAQEPIMIASKSTKESILWWTNSYNTKMRVKASNHGIRMRLLNLVESILSSTSQGLWWIDFHLPILTRKTYHRGRSLPFSLTMTKSISIMLTPRILRVALSRGMRMISKCLQISKQAQTRIRSLHRAYLIKGWMKSVKKNAKSERQSYMRPTISRESIILQDVFTETLNRIRLEKLVPLKWLTSRHTGQQSGGKKT